MSESSGITVTGFPQLLEHFEQREDGFAIDMPPDWLQGRTAYGGLSAALCLEATQRSFDNLPPLKSAYFSFLGPAVGNLDVTTDLLRQGKSTVFTQATVSGDSGIATRANFCFGHSRPATYEYSSLVAPEASSPAEYPDFFTWMNRPNFMRHFDGRLVSGGRPCSSGRDPEMFVWLRHRVPSVPSSAVGLIALADALPPAIFVTLSEPVPISTVTWSVDLLDETFETDEGWWLVRSVAEFAHEGFSSQVITIWASDGRPVLSARQNIAIFSGVSRK